MRIESGVTTRYIYFVAVDATDYASRETGLSSFTVYRSRNGAAAAVMTTPTINETDTTNMPGVYELLLDEDMTIGSGNDSEEMVFHITHAGMAPVTRTIELYRPKITAGETLTVTSGLASANTTQIEGVDATDQINAACDTAFTDYDPPTKAELDSGLAALNDPTAAAIADAVWDEAQSGHVGAGTFGEVATEVAAIKTVTDALPDSGALTSIAQASALATVDTNVDAILADTGTDGVVLAADQAVNVTKISGSATAADNLEASALGIVPGACEGTPTTTVIQTDLAEATDDHYIGRVVCFTSGAGAQQCSDITDYVGSTGTLTVTALTTAPSAGDTFVII